MLGLRLYSPEAEVTVTVIVTARVKPFRTTLLSVFMGGWCIHREKAFAGELEGKVKSQ